MAEVKHVVLLKFKSGTSPQQISGFFRSLAGLKAQIPGLTEFIGGPYSSPERLNQGYTHGFIMTFSDAAARNSYLPHPVHEKVKGEIVPHVDSIVSFDFDVS